MCLRFILIALVSLALTSCGLKGPLYMPPPDSQPAVKTMPVDKKTPVQDEAPAKLHEEPSQQSTAGN